MGTTPLKEEILQMLKESAIKLKTIHCFLVHPSKGEETQPPIVGAAVPLQGQLFSMLKGIFEKADIDCQTEICFNHNLAGEQQNDCRDLIISYIATHSIGSGRSTALRLQGVTTLKSGLGLLFLMIGVNGKRSKLVLSRFPANQGILAEQKKNSLTVEFLEKVFMKTHTAYKSVVYIGQLSNSDFWKGRAVDKQITNPGEHFANYWIRDFLASDFLTTPAAGTRRLAIALRTAMNSMVDLNAKNQIVAAVTLAHGVDGKTTSVNDFASFSLSPEVVTQVRKALKHDSLMSQHFQFDAPEFTQHIAFRSVELSNGGTLTAEASNFDEVFKQETLGTGDNEILFSTQGRIVDERLRKAKG